MLFMCSKSFLWCFLRVCVCVCVRQSVVTENACYLWILRITVWGSHCLPEMIRPLSRVWHLLGTALLRKWNAMFFVAALNCHAWFYNIRWPNFYHWMILEDLFEAQKSLTSEFVILGTVTTLTMFFRQSAVLKQIDSLCALFADLNRCLRELVEKNSLRPIKKDRLSMSGQRTRHNI